ncbi:MAG TPA: diguanylate cyclase [Anaerolineaceae bacterium]
MLFKIKIHPLVAIAVFSLSVFLVAVLIVTMGYPISLIILLSVGVILAAFNTQRLVYWLMILLLAACGIGLELLYYPGNYVMIPLFISLSIVLLITGELIQFYKAGVQKRQNALVESEQRNQGFLENTDDGIVLVDETGQVVGWNRGQERISGLRQQEVIGRPVWEAMFRVQNNGNKSRSTLDHLKLSVQEFVTTGHMQGIGNIHERQITRPDGSSRVIQEVAFPIKTEKGFMLGSVIRDITQVTHEISDLRQEKERLNSQVRDLQQVNREASLLNEMGDLLQSCLAVEDTYAVMGQFAEKIFPNQSGILYILNDVRNVYEAVTTWGTPYMGDTEFAPEACWSLRRGRTHVVVDSDTRLHCQHVHMDKKAAGTFVPHLCVPMTAQGETLGVLHLQAGKGEPVEKWERLAVTVAVRVALTLVNLRLRESLRMQSIRDPLTGLFNRRYMEETLERELHRAARHKLPVGVVMLDIDHFKLFNDEYGHDVGDAVLRELGIFLSANVRSEDVACRYGGEEFILILPEATLDDVIKRALKLRDGINSLKIQHLDQTFGPITVSQGVAGFPEHGASAGQVLRAVDAALYRAKRGGRDRVVLAEK